MPATRPSEDDLIASLFAPMTGAMGLGLRDDAACLAPPAGCDLVVTKDMLVAGVHFFPGDPPDAIARKALRVNLSDLAAKGATPFGFLLGLGLTSDWTREWLTSFAGGLADDSRTYACPLVGGDTVATPGPLTLSITAFGLLPTGRMVPRTGARDEDRLYVSGTIGDAALGLRLRCDERLDAAWIGAMRDEHVAFLQDRYLLPQPRQALAPVLLAHARAAMDVSDGLVGDLSKMVRLEGLSAQITVANIPFSPAVRAAQVLEPMLRETALTGGDDYEILCCVAPGSAQAFEDGAREVGVAVTCIGCVGAAGACDAWCDADGAPLAFQQRSFSHF